MRQLCRAYDGLSLQLFRSLPQHPDRFADGVEVLKDGTVLHLAFFCLADAELRLEGANDQAFGELKLTYADVLGGAPPDKRLDRCMELEFEPETGDMQMQGSLLVKRMYYGDLAELHTQPINLLDRCWIQH